MGVLINSPTMICFLVYDLDVIWNQYNLSVLKKESETCFKKYIIYNKSRALCIYALFEVCREPFIKFIIIFEVELNNYKF